jgi:hypothetical protein
MVIGECFKTISIEQYYCKMMSGCWRNKKDSTTSLFQRLGMFNDFLFLFSDWHDILTKTRPCGFVNCGFGIFKNAMFMEIMVLG